MGGLPGPVKQSTRVGVVLVGGAEMSKGLSAFVTAAILAMGLSSASVFCQSGQDAGVSKRGVEASKRSEWRRPGRRGGVSGAGGQMAVWRALRNPATRERLGLDAAQSERLDGIFFESSQKAIQLDADLKSLRLEMFRRLREENPDRAALEAKIDEIAAVRSNMARLRLDAFFQIHDLLTPEQRQALRQSLQERRGRARKQGRRDQP